MINDIVTIEIPGVPEIIEIGMQGPPGPTGPQPPLSAATPQPPGAPTPGTTGEASDAGHAHAVPTSKQVLGVAGNLDMLMYFTEDAGFWNAMTPPEVKNYLGMYYVDNTSDVNKPVSTAQALADTAVLNSAKGYADGLVVALWDDRGSFDASVNTYPTTGGSGTAGAILKGDVWTISVAATAGPLVGLMVGSTVRAVLDTPGQTAGNWASAQVGVGYVPQPLNTLLSAISALATTGIMLIGAGNTASTLAAGTANQIVGMDAAGTGYENKSILGTANQITVTHAAGSVTLSLPQSIHTGATPTFAGLITPKIYPAADSTTAIQINKADGTTNVLNVDTTNGNVGIGTTTPNTQLQIYGVGALARFTNTLNTSLLVGNGTSSLGIDLAVRNTDDGLYKIFRLDGSQVLINSQSGTGNVGIGTTGPVANLEIGTAITSAVPAGTVLMINKPNPYIRMVANDADPNYGSYFRGTYTTASQLIIGTRFGGVDTDVLTLSGGNVGIGTTAPLTKLVVEDGYLFINAGSSAINNGVQPAGIKLGSDPTTHTKSPIIANIRGATSDIQGIDIKTYNLGYVDAMTLLGNGNVGIGTTTPGRKLDVNGDANIGTNLVIGTGIYNNNYYPVSNIATHFFNSVGSEKLTILENGNVGIGTAAPTANLQVAQSTAGVGTVSVSAGGTAWTGTGTQFLNTFKVGNTITSEGQTLTIATITDNTHLTTDAVGAAISGKAYTLAGGTRFSVLGNGNVGIGTTTPGAALDVVGDIRTNSGLNVGDTTNASVAGGIRLARGSTNEPFIVFENGASAANALGQIRGIDGGGLRFTNGSSSVEWARFDTNGNVGIGTTTPTAKLTIQATAASGNVVDFYDNVGVTRTSINYQGNIVSVGDTIINSIRRSVNDIMWSAGKFDLGSATVIAYHSGTDSNSTAADIGLSRLSAGVLAVGNGTQGSATGTLIAGNVGIGTTTPTTGKLVITDTTLAGSAALAGSVLDLQQTWNTTGTPTAIKLNVTNTASNAASLLFDCQVGAVSKIRGDVAGLLTAQSMVSVAGFGCNGKAAQTAVTVNADSTDLATVVALCNQIRAALIADGIAA